MASNPIQPTLAEINALLAACQEQQQTIKGLQNELHVAKSHYTELLEYFKHLVWLTGGAVAIIVAVAGVLLYSNLRDVRQDAREQAGHTATEEAHKRVSEAFEEKNIQAMIQLEAEKQIKTVVGRDIEQQLTSRFQPIQDRIILIGRISECEARMHTGFRSGLVELNTILAATKDPNVRQFAQSTLTTMSEAYDSFWQASVFWQATLQASPKLPSQLIEFLNQTRYQQTGTTLPIAGLSGVVSAINEDQDLNDVAAAALVFRQMTGEKDIKMFDFQAVNKWCASHESQCKASSPPK